MKGFVDGGGVPETLAARCHVTAACAAAGPAGVWRALPC